jgi:hypothetical protein
MLFSRGRHRVRSGVRIKAGALLRRTAVGVSTLTVMIRFEFLQLSNDDRMQRELESEKHKFGDIHVRATTHQPCMLMCLTRYALLPQAHNAV